MKYLAIAFGFSLSFNAIATPYSIDDYEVDAYMERTIDTGYGLGRINGHGLDSTFNVRDNVDNKKQYSDVFTLDVNKEKFTIDFIKGTRWDNGIVFRLIQSDYSSTAQDDLWEGLKVDTNIEGLGLKNGIGWVELNFSNIRFTQDSYFSGSFDYQEVPEPLSTTLLFLGLLTLYVRKFRLG